MKEELLHYLYKGIETSEIKPKNLDLLLKITLSGINKLNKYKDRITVDQVKKVFVNKTVECYKNNGGSVFSPDCFEAEIYHDLLRTKICQAL